MAPMRVRTSRRAVARAAAITASVTAGALGAILLASFALPTLEPAGIGVPDVAPLAPATTKGATVPAPSAHSAKAADAPGSAPAVKMRPVRLYFADAGGRLKSETREIEDNPSLTRQARAAVELLLEGPKTGGLLPIFPKGGQLLALFLDASGEAYLDFTREIQAPTGIEEEFLCLASLAETLATNFPECTSVQIVIDGHEAVDFRGHVSIEYPLTTRDPAYDALLGEGEAPPPALPEAPAAPHSTPPKKGPAAP